MVNHTSNHRLLQFIGGDINFDESFSKNDGLTLLNRLLEQIRNYQLNIKVVVEKFIRPEQGKSDLAIITCLVFHLSYLDYPVSCKIAKPFLPWQADKELKITARTPITIHITKCLDCRNDIEILRQLDLEQKQLVRLGKLFSKVNHRNQGSCCKTKKAMESIVKMDFSATTAEILRHVCVCKRCRGLLYKERNAIYSSLSDYDSPESLTYESFSSSDLFVYAIPYGLDPVDDQYAKFQPSFTSHLMKCPRCLERMLKLHNRIYEILERPDSGIVTCSDLDRILKGDCDEKSVSKLFST